MLAEVSVGIRRGYFGKIILILCLFAVLAISIVT